MSIPFDGRAFICTTIVMAAFAGLARAELPDWPSGPGHTGSEIRMPLGFGGPEQRDERQEVILEVLRFEARIHANEPACAQTVSQKTAFDRDRETERSIREEVRQRPDSVLREHLDGSRERDYGWRRPTNAVFENYERSQSLDPAASRSLSLTVSTLLARPATALPSVTIDPSTVPPSLRPGQPRCGSLGFTAPAILNDVAFVETSFVCGGLCGNGWLYALRRRDGRWQIEAIVYTWVS